MTTGWSIGDARNRQGTGITVNNSTENGCAAAENTVSGEANLVVHGNGTASTF